MLAKAPPALPPPTPLSLFRRGVDDVGAPSRAPLRADHGLLLTSSTTTTTTSETAPAHRARLCRTQPQLLPLLAASPTPPVAQVLPTKRRQPTPATSPTSPADAECRPPCSKLPRTAVAATAVATNPLFRRRSRDPPLPPPPQSPLATPADRRFAIANVAFPTMPLPPPPPSQLLQTPSVVAGGKRDAQTSPRCTELTTAAPAPAPSPSASSGGGGGGGVSLTCWVRSARCRLAARLRRSLSASSSSASARIGVPTSVAADAATPKRVVGGGICGDKRKRHASLQRLVQRLTASPKSFAAAAAAAASAGGGASPSPSSGGGGAAPGVRGRILQLLPDGSRTVRLQRPRGAKFGFFVARQQDGVFVSRFNDPATQHRYRSILGVGDQILEIEGRPAGAMELADMHRFISDRRCLVVLVRSQYSGCCAW